MFRMVASQSHLSLFNFGIHFVLPTHVELLYSIFLLIVLVVWFLVFSVYRRRVLLIIITVLYFMAIGFKFSLIIKNAYFIT